MATTNDGARLSVTRLILVPSLITLAVTILRVYAELHHWGSPWVSNGVGGGPSIIGIVWLAPIFGIYFASKLAAMGAGPASTGKTIGFTMLGVVVFVAGRYTAFGGSMNPARIMIGLALMAAGGLLVLPVWRELFKVLVAYAYAARIPVAIVMYFAMRGNWGTHYDAVPPGYPANASFWTKYIELGILPQFVLWVAFTILAGTLFGAIVVAVRGRAKGPAHATA